MDAMNLGLGELMFGGGILLAAVSAGALLIGAVLFAARKSRLKKKLTDQYGF